MFHSSFLFLCVFTPVFLSRYSFSTASVFTVLEGTFGAMGWIGLTRWRVKESLIIPGIDPPSYLIPRYEAAHRFPTGMLGL